VSREQINSNAGDLHTMSREILGIDWYDTEPAARRVIEWVAKNRAGTPSHRWTEDPHAGQYDGERADLAMGDLTDDELANAVFMYGNHMPEILDVIAGKAQMPIAYLTAAKERIRWLSRRLDATLEALAVWDRPEPWGENDIIPLGEGSITGEAYRRGVEAGRRQVGGTPLLDVVVDAIDRYKEDPATYSLDGLLEDIRYVASTQLPEGLEVRAMGEANTYAVLKDGNWAANVRMNGEMTVDRQAALLHAVCSGWNAQVPIKVVADISGGALHGVYAEVPVEVLFISDDGDDIASQMEELSDYEMRRDTGGNLVASWVQASDGGQDAEMVQHYFEQKV